MRSPQLETLLLLYKDPQGTTTQTRFTQVKHNCTQLHFIMDFRLKEGFRSKQQGQGEATIRESESESFSINNHHGILNSLNLVILTSNS